MSSSPRSSPRRSASSQQLRHDGSPHIVPVWFRWDGGAVQIWTTEACAWLRNLLRDPRVAFSVQTFDEPYPAVVTRGRPSSR
jgi:nitroimidazol reductase NimA-like FMN-containing flavoprotein (pyridoxamine 5'-phosphate oxidase superfamily)